nr:GvpL/GvpF family gas vesicle protein [uncultured Rhodopila sp.]
MTGGYHLFALVPAETKLPDPLPAGLEQGAVTLLPIGLVAGVAQAVSGEFLAQLQEGNSDPAAQQWLTDRLLEHEHVVEAFVSAGPVFPLGFGVLVADPAALREAVSPHLETLSAFFDGAAGRQEWCLKFYLHDEAPRRGEMAQAARSGLDYLAARRALPERLAAREAAGRVFVESSLADLGRHCEGMLGREAGTAPGKGLRLLANVALLVRSSARTALEAAVDGLIAPASHEGLELTLTGPWPLYSFRPLISLGVAPQGR